MDASKITANVKYDLAISQIVLGKKMWLEKRGEYTYFLVTDEAEPWKRSRDWERLKDNYSPAKWDEYNSQHHILAGEKRYTLDISAAFEVAQKIGGLHLIEFTAINHKWRAAFKENVAEAETAPLAICRAALLAVVPVTEGGV